MSAPSTPPRHKNPVLRTPQINLPPVARGRVALHLTAAAAEGRFELQVCEDCGAVQYPPREACGACLSSRLVWRKQSGLGELLASTTLHHSNDLYFHERLPWRVAFVRLDDGPTVMAHVASGVGDAPTRVRVHAYLDRSGQGVLVAGPSEGGQGAQGMADDRVLHEMTSDPRGRRVLVTDGKTPVGQALVRALIGAGARSVWAGRAEPWKKLGGMEEIAALPGVEIVPLDVTDVKSVTELAGSIGGQVEILVNNAEHHRTGGIADQRGTGTARDEMEINYFGLLRLAQAFAPALKSRAADGKNGASAWVNVLSIQALANFPPQGTFSASKAAAFSLSQCLRAELQPAGIRVVNVFPGPVDDEWNQRLLPPKLGPAALAKAVVQALRDGVEDVYPGDVARDWLARWKDDPKVLERELAIHGS
ncbi:MAG TPA: SDR family NAD(P)-dependent oxidoreductase [Nevskiaceae bacterium]